MRREGVLVRTSVNATYRRLVLLILFAPALRVSSFTHFSTKYMMKTSYCEGDPDGPRSEEPREGGGEYLPIPIDEAWSCCSKLAGCDEGRTTAKLTRICIRRSSRNERLRTKGVSIFGDGDTQFLGPSPLSWTKQHFLTLVKETVTRLG